jgi:hypothetical protein
MPSVNWSYVACFVSGAIIFNLLRLFLLFNWSCDGGALLGRCVATEFQVWPAAGTSADGRVARAVSSFLERLFGFFAIISRPRDTDVAPS